MRGYVNGARAHATLPSSGSPTPTKMAALAIAVASAGSHVVRICSLGPYRFVMIPMDIVIGGMHAQHVPNQGPTHMWGRNPNLLGD